MTAAKEKILMCILKRTVYEANLINNIHYDFYDVLCDQSEFLPDGDIDVDGIMSQVFSFGFQQIKEAVELRKDWLLQGKIKNSLTIEEEYELMKLNELDPFEDFSFRQDFLDMYVYCVKNESVYKNYFGEVLDGFTWGTGHEICFPT